MWKSLDSQLRVILSLGDTWQFLGAFWLPHWSGLEMKPTRFSAVWVEKLGLQKGSQDLLLKEGFQPVHPATSFLTGNPP